MKRSEINYFIEAGEKTIRECGTILPPFAYYPVEKWQQMGPEALEIAQLGLGWDITDFGSRWYEKIGLLSCTVRNGHTADWQIMPSRLYCEKVLLVGSNQMIPVHFHRNKVEDLINRGGGNLFIQLYNEAADEELDRYGDVMVSMDGIQRTIRAGSVVILPPGESIRLPSHQYYQFWGEKKSVLVSEISSGNEDAHENRYYDPVGHFFEIEEDEPPQFLLVSDYKTYYRFA